MYVVDLFDMCGMMSAYCKHSLSGVICDISATHRLNYIDPNLKPCGTPKSNVKE